MKALFVTCWFFVWWLGGPLLAASPTCYRMNVGAPAIEPTMAGLRVVIHTITQTDNDLLVRLGVFNAGDKPVATADKLASDDIMLVSFAQGSRFQTAPTTHTLTEICPSGTLAAKAVNNGLLTFAWGSKEADAARLGTLTLRVAHFAPISFSLDKDKVFTPLDFSTIEKRSPLNLDVAAQAEGMAIFTMRLNSLVVKDNELEVVLGFQNSSRFPVTWKGGINGTMCRLITAHGEMVAPSQVSDSFKERIAPPGNTWLAHEDNFGWIRFPMPSPEAAEDIAFGFAGYPSVRFTFNRDQHVWQPAAKAKAADAPVTGVEAVIDEERNYAAVKTFWSAATDELARARFTAFLKRFTGDAHKDQRTSIASWSKLPVTSVELSVPEYQRVRPNEKGFVKNVRVQMKYTLATLPRDNIFISNMECDMRRDGDGAWSVEGIRYPNLQPFWLLGYTGVSRSDHFTIFHRNSPETHKEVELAVQQLEKSFVRLLKMGLPLKPHNAAFLVASKPDFEKLTDRNADSYSGVATSAYLYRDGQVSVINKAMYINDYRFFSLQRAWGKQDRQVVIQHEMAHLAFADHTRPWTPAWLTEGVAMIYANQCDSFTRAALRRALTDSVTIPGLSRVSRLGAESEDATRLMTEYQLSGEAVTLLMKKFGAPAVINCYIDYATQIPEDLAKLQGKGAEAKAARIKIARRVFARHFGDLSLEQLDALVRSVVNG